MACHRSTRPSHCAARSRVLTTYRARQGGWGSAPRTDALCYYIIIKGTMWSSLHCLLLRTPLSHAAIATGLQAEPVWNLKDVCLPSFSWLCCWPNVEDSTTQGRAEPQEEELEFLNHYMEDCVLIRTPVLDFPKRETASVCQATSRTTVCLSWSGVSPSLRAVQVEMLTALWWLFMVYLLYPEQRPHVVPVKLIYTLRKNQEG